MEQTTVNRRYRVDRKIGDGGMAEVYLGRDLLLNRAVAIKVLRRQYAADPNFRTRFEREAQNAAGFSHPNIIDIYDVGEEQGTPYIVMEYVNGQTLKEIIEQEGPFHPDDVAALLEQVAAALDYAHERGLVHRDVKPQNILVDADGLAKVVDFGIAKGLSDSNLTDTGTALGTVHYLSPEQASGLMATPASDIYSLAVVAFEMLTGGLPFDADTPIGVALQHLHDQPPKPSSVNQGVAKVVDEIVVRALAKDPTRRFASAGAFAQAMVDWRDYRPGGGGGNGPQPARTAMVGSTVPAAGTTVALPRAGEAARTRPGAPGLARPVAPPLQVDGERRRDDVGCLTWIVGTAVLVGLIVLIWIGFQLSPRIGGSNDNDPTAVPTATTLAVVAAPTATATPEQVIAPVAPTVTPTPTVVVVPVPDLTGRTLDEATRLVTDRGLLLEEREPIFTDAVPVGTVAEQDPAPESGVAQGTTVFVRLSQGAATIDLTKLNLVGRDPDDAQRLLEDRNLIVERIDVGSAEIGEGLVAGSDPADSAAAGDVVTLYVSVGDKVQIPAALQGQPLDQAVAQLEGLGFQVAGTIGVDRVTIESFGVDLDASGIRDGDVVGVQDNGAAFGAWVAPGSSVTVVYYDHRQDVL